MIKTTPPNAGIFIDNANFFYAQKKAGWKVDVDKLKLLLSSDFQISFVHYHIAIPAVWDKNYPSTQKYIRIIGQKYSLYTKPLKYIKVGKSILKKGDVDLELTLDIVRNLDSLDVCIIVSGDSDYIELRKYILEEGKKIIFMSFRQNMAWEIKQGKYVLFDNLRPQLELINTKTPEGKPGRL